MKIAEIGKIWLVFAVMIITGFINKSVAQQKFERAVFYNVMSAGDMAAVNNELDVVENSALGNKDGYEGALLLKKAGLVALPKKKLDLFKAGRIKLETAILADDANTEFHFLRLAIEEHAPKIVKYSADITKDKTIVEQNYKNLSPVVQKAILDYCKNSKVLHAEDL